MQIKYEDLLPYDEMSHELWEQVEDFLLQAEERWESAVALRRAGDRVIVNGEVDEFELVHWGDRTVRIRRVDEQHKNSVTVTVKEVDTKRVTRDCAMT